MTLATVDEGAESLLKPDFPRSRFIYTALEAVRFPVEVLTTSFSKPLLSQLPQGDGHTVVVLPPFMGSDQITSALRKRVQQMGYDVRGWGLGINRQTNNSSSMPEALQQRKLVSQHLSEHIQSVAEEVGHAVSLIGWSLGGIHALEVAQNIPGSVRQIITLGSPLGDPRATAIYALMNANGNRQSSNQEALDWIEGLDKPLIDVPFTCVYSDSDGIVNPSIAKTSSGHLRQNIRVNSTHLGMAFNSRVYYVLANRLQLDSSNWQPMDTPAWLNWPL